MRFVPGLAERLKTENVRELVNFTKILKMGGDKAQSRSLPSRNRNFVKVVKNDAEADVKDFYSCYFLLCPINFFRNCSIQILNGETSAKKMLTKLYLKIKKKKKKKQ